MANANRLQIDVMKTLPYGVELETIGASKEALARAIASVVGGDVASDGYYRDRWTVTQADGRKWRVEHDGSLSGASLSGEVVTPKLRWEDMETLQRVVRALRGAGATVNLSCGLHVHVGVVGAAGSSDPTLDGAALGRLAKLCYQQEPLLYRALNVTRGTRYCREASPEFIERLIAARPRTRDELLSAWYGGDAARDAARSLHRHDSRYRGLNLHAVAYHGTAEFRYFDGTLHAGKVKTYVHLALALVAKAMTLKNALPRQRTFNASTARYDTRVFLLRLGLIGPVFETTRHHLLDHLAGSASRRGPKVVQLAPLASTSAEPPPSSTPAPLASTGS